MSYSFCSCSSKVKEGIYIQVIHVSGFSPMNINNPLPFPLSVFLSICLESIKRRPKRPIYSMDHQASSLLWWVLVLFEFVFLLSVNRSRFPSTKFWQEAKREWDSSKEPLLLLVLLNSPHLSPDHITLNNGWRVEIISLWTSPLEQYQFLVWNEHSFLVGAVLCLSESEY